MSPKRFITVAILLAVSVTAPSIDAATSVEKVSTVTANTFNRELHTRWLLTGKPVKKLASKPVPLPLYTKLRGNNVRTKHLCRKYAKWARATWYEDATGYQGDRLANHPRNFAELSKNPAARDYSALGKLTYKTKLWFHNRVGRRIYSAWGKKYDIGAGGRRKPKVDLWRGKNGLANALRFTDGMIRYTHKPCRGAFK